MASAALTIDQGVDVTEEDGRVIIEPGRVSAEIDAEVRARIKALLGL